MISKICKSLVVLGGLVLVTSCTTHRTVYVSEARLQTVPDRVLVVTPQPLYVYECEREFFFFDSPFRRMRPFYPSREYFGRRYYYVPGHYVHRYARPSTEFQFGIGFSKRFR